jgi:hypothetical protein
VLAPAGAADTLGEGAGVVGDETGALDGTAELAGAAVLLGAAAAVVAAAVLGVLVAEDVAGLAEELQAVNSKAMPANDANEASCLRLGAIEVLMMSNPFPGDVTTTTLRTPPRLEKPGRRAVSTVRSG